MLTSHPHAIKLHIDPLNRSHSTHALSNDPLLSPMVRQQSRSISHSPIGSCMHHMHEEIERDCYIIMGDRRGLFESGSMECDRSKGFVCNLVARVCDLHI